MTREAGGLFENLDEICKPGAILATTTSSLPIIAMAKVTSRPQDVIGMHFFSPANVMKLLENVRGDKTSDQVVATTMAVSKRIKKIPTLVGVCHGFVGNRMLFMRGIEANKIILEGATPAQVDKVIFDFGFPMGPFAMSDLAGLDISFLHREAARARGEMIPDTPGDLLVRAGRKGQKTGGGWYDYETGDRTPKDSAEAARVIAPMVGPQRTMSSEAIVDRLLAAMAAEGQAILEEDIAASAADIDLVEVHGYGFPPRRGGPMFHAARQTK